MIGDEPLLSRIVAVNADLLVDAGLKSLLVLAATALVAWGLGRRSAALLHGVWTAGFLICAAIPVVALTAPAWTLAILPATSQSSGERVGGAGAEQFANGALRSQGGDSERSKGWHADLRYRGGRLVRSESLMDRPDVAHAGVQEKSISAAIAIARSPVAEQSSQLMPSWPMAALTCWLLGVAVICIRSGWRTIQLRTFLRSCHAITDAKSIEAFEDAARRLQFRRSARLLESAEAEGPLVAGIVTANVVLPADARHWNAERRDMVFLHELTHVKRCDVLTQTIAGLVCAIHWFNPLAWLGLAQMRKLRELACDDMVVAVGRQPTDYADVLLGVARAYRHRGRELAVGMARGANVERRILAILDRARNRMPLSRRAVRALLTLAVVAATAVGTVRLKSRAETAPADPPAAEEKAAKEKATDKKDQKATATETQGLPAREAQPEPQLPEDPNGRTMEVIVTDAAGAPIEGADVKASIWEFEGEPDYPTWDYKTDAQGIAKVKRPSRVNILRLWPEKQGYVTQFVNFAEGTHEEGEKIPDRYEFQLEQATKVGGIVVDEADRPIRGVTVQVKVDVDEPTWGANPKSMISTWVGEDGLSDQDGVWSVVGLPGKPKAGKDFEFRLKFVHDDYISDENYGTLQREHSITTAGLRDGTARVVMRQGIPVKGTITNSNGSPVTKGLVIWSDNTYFAEGVNECQLGEDGRFQTAPFVPGKRSLTVLAPGYCPDRREVLVSQDMSAADFVLKPGKRLTLKVVDREGKPIPKAYVGIGPWRGVNAIYNEKHSNVPESHIPRHADEHGVYVWDWAPEDAVTYQVSAKGYASVSAPLVARPSESMHVVELPKPLVASGQVIDASTGRSIEQFTAISVIEFRPKFLTTRFDHSAVGKEGEYELPLEGGGDDSYRYRVRVEAEGYRTKLSSESFGTKDGDVKCDFKLDPAVPRRGIVVDATGTPIVGAAVVEATPSVFPTIYSNKVRMGDQQVETDASGAFQLRATSEPYRLRVLHQTAGYAEVARTPDEPVGTITLQPWAKVSGQLLQAGKPIANERVLLGAIVNPPLGEPRIQGNYQALTDGEGRFEFEQVAPVASSIRTLLGPWEDSPLTSSQSDPLDLQPGEHRTVILGGEGATVAGRVAATGRDNDELDKNWSLSYLISRERGIDLPAGSPQPSFDPSKPVEASWFLDPASNDWQATRMNYFVKLATDGAFRINGVPPGTYDLVLRLYEQPASCLVETIGEKVVTVEVTEADVAAGLKEMGEITVPCRSGPRVGQSMAAFRFVDATGREIYVNELKGRHVLMHAWASWCGPCLESMPELKGTVDSLAEKPITFVGLNLDQDVEAGRRVAERARMTWAQNYLGDDSDLAKQLAISSAPTYYLIGPEGTLVASSTEWSDMKALLAAAFAE